jgi:transposase-like protein
MAIEKEIVDRLLANYERPEDLTGENGVLRQLTKALMERALEAEMAPTWDRKGMTRRRSRTATAATEKARRL